MLVSDLDMQQDKDLSRKLKTWASSLNIAAKKEGAPTFKLAGPCTAPVRERKPGSAGSVRNHAFMGGEEWRISTIYVERRPAVGLEIMVALAPATLAVAATLSSMTIGLDKAIELFDGLAAWVDVSVVEPKSAVEAREREKQAVAALPTVEETRASETWGAW